MSLTLICGTATSVIKKRLVGISFGFAIWYGVFGRNIAGAIDELPQLNREDVNIIPREIELRPRIFPASATEKKDHFSYRNIRTVFSLGAEMTKTRSFTLMQTSIVVSIVSTTIAIFLPPYVMSLIYIDSAKIRTRVTISKNCHQVFMYFRKYNRLPTSLDELSVNIQDEWGNKITYKIIDKKKISMQSLGLNNKKGGEGNNKDIIVIFDLEFHSYNWQ
ncbi:hypothetical protein [Candidatus Uabimicrobium sp. HlEnr_7]|uniref:hypothetical protein n=1 Tax=Candidatus Uabimicrobium helgolandensis TaxID=3095367 RepID=UPI0035584945